MLKVQQLKSALNIDDSRDALLITFLYASQDVLDIALSGYLMPEIEKELTESSDATAFAKELINSDNAYLSYHVSRFCELQDSLCRTKNGKDILFKILLVKEFDLVTSERIVSPLMKCFKKIPEIKYIKQVIDIFSYHVITDDFPDNLLPSLAIIKENLSKSPKNQVIKDLTNSVVNSRDRNLNIMSYIIKRTLVKSEYIKNNTGSIMEELTNIKNSLDDADSDKEIIRTLNNSLNHSNKIINEYKVLLEEKDSTIAKLEHTSSNNNRTISTLENLLKITGDFEKEQEQEIVEDEDSRIIVGCKPLTIVGGTIYFGKKLRDYINKYNLDIKYIDSASRLNKDESNNRVIIFNAYGTPHHILFRLNALYKDQEVKIIVSKDVRFIKEYLIYE